MPAGVRIMPRAFPHDPDKRFWLRCKMQLMCDHEVLESSDDVECEGGIVLVEG